MEVFSSIFYCLDFLGGRGHFILILSWLLKVTKKWDGLLEQESLSLTSLTIKNVRLHHPPKRCKKVYLICFSSYLSCPTRYHKYLAAFSLECRYLFLVRWSHRTQEYYPWHCSCMPWICSGNVTVCVPTLVKGWSDLWWVYLLVGLVILNKI